MHKNRRKAINQAQLHFSILVLRRAFATALENLSLKGKVSMSGGENDRIVKIETMATSVDDKVRKILKAVGDGPVRFVLMNVVQSDNASLCSRSRSSRK